MQFLTTRPTLQNHSTENAPYHPPNILFLKNPKSIVAVCQLSDMLPVMHDAEQRKSVIKISLSHHNKHNSYQCREVTG